VDADVQGVVDAMGIAIVTLDALVTGTIKTRARMLVLAMDSQLQQLQCLIRGTMLLVLQDMLLLQPIIKLNVLLPMEAVEPTFHLVPEAVDVVVEVTLVDAVVVSERTMLRLMLLNQIRLWSLLLIITIRMECLSPLMKRSRKCISWMNSSGLRRSTMKTTGIMNTEKISMNPGITQPIQTLHGL